MTFGLAERERFKLLTWFSVIDDHGPLAGRVLGDLEEDGEALASKPKAKDPLSSDVT